MSRLSLEGAIQLWRLAHQVPMSDEKFDILLQVIKMCYSEAPTIDQLQKRIDRLEQSLHESRETLSNLTLEVLRRLEDNR